MSEDLNDKIEEIYHQQDINDKIDVQNLEQKSFGKFIDKVVVRLKGRFSKWFILSKLDPRIKRIKEEGYYYLVASGDAIEAARRTISKIFHLD